MFKKISFIGLFLSVLLMGFMFFESKFNDHAQPWKNYQKPHLAVYASLEKDQSILNDLSKQVVYRSHKPMDSSFFQKPNIFNPITQ